MKETRNLALFLRTEFSRTGKSHTALARALGLNSSAISRILGGERQVKAHEMDIIRAFFDAPEQQTLQPPATVPEIDVKAGAGGGGALAVHDQPNGLEHPAESVRDHWGLPDSFVRYEMRGRATDMVILPVIGDSMVNPERPWQIGTFLPGDRVIVDRMRNQPSPPGAFAVYDGIGVVIKIVSPVMGADPPRLRLASQNPLYEPYEVLSEEAGIIGRVVGRITAF